MKILVVAPTLPRPDARHAGGLYLRHHLEALAARDNDVTLLCIDTSAVPSDLADARGSVDIVLADPDRGAIGPAERWRGELRSRLRAAALTADSVAALLASGLVDRARDADLVELQWPELAVLLPLLRAGGVSAPIAIVEHDVAAESAPSRARQRGRRRARLAMPLLRRVRDLVERRDLDLADLVLVFKQPDIDLLRRLGVRADIEVIQPRLDEPTVTPVAAVPSEVLFTGAMWRPENDDAARWLLRRVWPSVRRAVPAARLTIVGAGPSEALVADAMEAGDVEVTGEVPDLEPYYRGAAVFVAPLWTAGGLKFKVPQAMRYGLPVVASSVAAAGIDTIAPPSVLWAVTDDPEEMAEAIIDALRSPERAAAVGRAAAAWTAHHYSFDRSMDRLVGTYRELVRARHP